MVDDMGYGDVSLANNPYTKTPHLDELASNSVNFKYFYVSPVCAPTRASLLTGRYHQEVGVRSVTNGYETINPEAVTLAEILKSAGYQTGIYGKWHLGEYYPSLPNAQGFDDYFGFRTGHTEDYFDPVLEHNGEMEETTGYIADILTDKAIDFMVRTTRQPFFCYLPYNTPHSPLQIEEEKFQPFLDMGLKEKEARVYAMVENIDDNIGRIINKLKSAKILDNTIVIFLSDNGPISGWQIPQEKMRYNAGLKDQKFTVYEGGIRTQCYWMWQGQWDPFYDTTSIAAHIDVVPTIASILDIPLADSLSIDGVNLTPTLIDQEPVEENRYLFEDYDITALRDPELFKGGMARQANWKMVSGTKLYNLSDDPGEQNNIADAHPEIMQKMKNDYADYYKQSYSKSYFQPKPIPVGYDEENPTLIKMHHGLASGNVKFSRAAGGTHPTGVDGNWTSGWEDPGDAMKWEVNFTTDTRYQLGLSMNGKIMDQTSVFNILIGDNEFEVALPELTSDEWQYVPLFETEASDIAQVVIKLSRKGESDIININELVITKLD